MIQSLFKIRREASQALSRAEGKERRDAVDEIDYERPARDEAPLDTGEDWGREGDEELFEGV